MEKLFERAKKAEAKNKRIYNNFLAFCYKQENPEIPFNQLSAMIVKIIDDKIKPILD